MRACILVLLAAVVTHGAGQTTFRVQTELVRIDVLVERNGQPVADLVATDFIVEDNGVRQTVKLLPASETATVSTVLDVSGSMTAAKLNNAAAGVRAVTAALRDRDRHTLYAFAGDVGRIVLPGTHEAPPAGSLARVLRQTSGPRTSLCDALFAAIVAGDVQAGPKLLTVLTDGRNNTSWLSARSVIDTAVRHETVIYPVAVGADSSRHPANVPAMLANDALRLLQLLAERTGGRLIHADWSRDLGPVFGSLVREYRQRYILSFVPEGVDRGDGWHRLTVKLRNRPGRVHARSGYWSR
jgi:VWFA-related protein